MKATVPMSRLGMPEECAGTLLYLASDAMSGYVTGQVIEVNTPDAFFSNPQHERSKLFLSQILR